HRSARDCQWSRSSKSSTMDSTSNFPASFPPLAADSIRRHEGSIEITTRPDPRTGSTHRLFDPLDWIHAVTADIPDRGRHCVRYYGALANRAQSPKAFCEQQTPPAPDPAASGETTSDFVQRRRTSWARLIKRIFEVDPPPVQLWRRDEDNLFHHGSASRRSLPSNSLARSFLEESTGETFMEPANPCQHVYE